MHAIHIEKKTVATEKYGLTNEEDCLENKDSNYHNQCNFMYLVLIQLVKKMKKIYIASW